MARRQAGRPSDIHAAATPPISALLGLHARIRQRLQHSSAHFQTAAQQRAPSAAPSKRTTKQAHLVEECPHILILAVCRQARDRHVEHSGLSGRRRLLRRCCTGLPGGGGLLGRGVMGRGLCRCLGLRLRLAISGRLGGGGRLDGCLHGLQGVTVVQAAASGLHGRHAAVCKTDAGAGWWAAGAAWRRRRRRQGSPRPRTAPRVPDSHQARPPSA